MFWPRLCIAALHSLMFGVAVGSLGPYLVEGNSGSIFADMNMLDSWKQSLATALTLFAAMFSALFANIPTASLGVKKMFAINSIVWFIAGALVLPMNLLLFFIARVVLGIGVGISSTLAPVFMAEISHKSVQGFTTSFHQLFITGALFIISILSYWFSNISHGWWYINSIMVMSLGFLMFILNFFLVESPIWLLKNGLEYEALDVLRSLRSGFNYQTQYENSLKQNSDQSTPLLNNSSVQQQQQIDPAQSGLYAFDLDHLHDTNNVNTHEIHLNQELQELKNQLNSGNSNEEVSWGELLSPRYRKQLLFGVALMLSSSLCGINAVTMFVTKIFGFAGLKDDEAIYGTIGAGFACFFMSFIAMLTIERFGRRTLFITGAAGCVLCLVTLSVVLLTLNAQQKIQGIIAVAGVIGFIMSFNTGLGGVPWCLLPEITASKVRTKMQSFFCFVNWLGNFIMVFATLPMVELFGGGTTADNEKQGAAILFIIFAIFSGLALAFGVFFLIETKGKSEAQIQLLLGNDENQIRGTDSSITA